MHWCTYQLPFPAGLLVSCEHMDQRGVSSLHAYQVGSPKDSLLERRPFPLAVQPQRPRHSRKNGLGERVVSPCTLPPINMDPEGPLLREDVSSRTSQTSGSMLIGEEVNHEATELFDLWSVRRPAAPDRLFVAVRQPSSFPKQTETQTTKQIKQSNTQPN